ncbi:hypothetical protein CKA32_006659 [Geitlerinema sp. FC II]|nr:hypothetical protein CKA32_006659 [Geitlerinema sp. FC II]
MSTLPSTFVFPTGGEFWRFVDVVDVVDGVKEFLGRGELSRSLSSISTTEGGSFSLDEKLSTTSTNSSISFCEGVSVVDNFVDGVSTLPTTLSTNLNFSDRPLPDTSPKPISDSSEKYFRISSALGRFFAVKVSATSRAFTQSPRCLANSSTLARWGARRSPPSSNSE